MARRANALLTLCLLGSLVLCSLAQYNPETSSAGGAGVDCAPMVQRVTRRLQEVESTSASTAVDVAAAGPFPTPSFDTVRSGMQTFFGKMGDWFAEVGQLSPRLPSLPQRQTRDTTNTDRPSGGSSSDRSSRSSGPDSRADRRRSSSSSSNDRSTRRSDRSSSGRNGRDTSHESSRPTRRGDTIAVTRGRRSSRRDDDASSRSRSRSRSSSDARHTDVLRPVQLGTARPVSATSQMQRPARGHRAVKQSYEFPK